MVNLVAHSRSMGKQKRHLLSLETSVDFELIGICSHHSDYRLTWGLNQELKLQLAKSDELFLIPERNQIDYFLFVRDNVTLEMEDILDNIKKINSVMAAYLFEAESLPSAEQIIF